MTNKQTEEGIIPSTLPHDTPDVDDSVGDVDDHDGADDDGGGDVEHSSGC